MLKLVGLHENPGTVLKEIGRTNRKLIKELDKKGLDCECKVLLPETTHVQILSKKTQQPVYFKTKEGFVLNNQAHSYEDYHLSSISGTVKRFLESIKGKNIIELKEPKDGYVNLKDTIEIAIPEAKPTLLDKMINIFK